MRWGDNFLGIGTSLTELKTGRSRCLLPPLPGDTPPTILVPYSMACLLWKVPYRAEICSTRQMRIAWRVERNVGRHFKMYLLAGEALANDLGVLVDQDARLGGSSIQTPGRERRSGSGSASAEEGGAVGSHSLYLMRAQGARLDQNEEKRPLVHDGKGPNFVAWYVWHEMHSSL